MPFIAPEVNPEPVPGIRVQPQANEETFGGGAGLAAMGQEVQKVAMQSGDIGAFEKIRADQTAVQEATAKLAFIHTNLLTDPKEGLPAYQGVNAMTGQDKLWQQYKKSANEISDGLTTEQQKGAFNKVAISMGDAFNQHVKAHVAQEMEKHDSQTFESLVNNLADASAKTYGNSRSLQTNYDLIKDATVARAQRLGLDDNETQKLTRGVMTAYHEEILGQMVNDPASLKQAKAYFSKYRDEMDTQSQDRVRNLLDVIPRQHEEQAKKAQEEFYKQNMRQAMLDMFDGKMSLSEAQRLFRENRLDKSDYNVLASKLSKADAMVDDPLLHSDPETFNNIRKAQLSGSTDPGEVQRMIAKGVASKDIGMEDGKYLMTMNSERPPTARDAYIDGAANHVRDFANRYFAEKNFFGMETDALKQKKNDEAEALVQQFYTAVDKSKAAQGQQIDDIKDRLIKTAAQNRFPSLGHLDNMPDIVVDVKGKVTQLLSPDQHSALKPRYKIQRAGPPKPEDES